MNELLDNAVITDEFLEGMKCVGKALAKECKRQQLEIKEAEEKAHFSWDRETIAEKKEELAHCVKMKVLAEKLYKKAKHIKEERETKEE